MTRHGSKRRRALAVVFGFDYLSRFCERAILHHCEGEHCQVDHGGEDASADAASSAAGMTDVMAKGSTAAASTTLVPYTTSSFASGFVQVDDDDGPGTQADGSPPAFTNDDWDDDERFLLEDPPDW